MIQLFQRLSDAVPNVGQTLVLIENEGLPTQKEQYIRATAVSVVERSFTYNTDQDYKAAVVTVAISDALRFDFTGSPASRTFTRATNSTKTRDTVVADAGTYVGVVPLTQAANVGDFTIKGASIYTQLVPSAQTETPISFVPPYAAAGLPVLGAAPVSYTASHAWNTSIKFNLPGGCLPGSLSIVTDGITIFDDAGLLKTASGTLGTIDYANGILSLNSGSMSNSKAITYTPAAQLQRAPQSAEIAVTPESRSQSYVGTVNPVPQPGTLAISYMAQGTLVRAFGWRQWLPQRAGCQLRRGHFQQEHRGLRRDLGGTARRGLVADPDVERADPGNAAANRRSEGIAGPAACPARRQKRSAGLAHHHLATRERHGHAHGVRHHVWRAQWCCHQ